MRAGPPRASANRGGPPPPLRPPPPGGQGRPDTVLGEADRSTTSPDRDDMPLGHCEGAQQYDASGAGARWESRDRTSVHLRAQSKSQRRLRVKKSRLAVLFAALGLGCCLIVPI